MRSRQLIEIIMRGKGEKVAIDEKQLYRFMLNPGHQKALKSAASSVICFAHTNKVSEEDAINLFNLGLRIFIEDQRSSIERTIEKFDKEFLNPDGSLNKEKAMEFLNRKK